MWELDHKEDLAPKKWCFRIVVLEKTLQSLLDSKGIQAVNTERNQPWVFIGRTDAEAEAPVLWPPDVKTWLIGKDSDAGKDWGQEEKRVTEEKIVGWHHWLNGHEFEQTPGDSEGQGSLACCSPWLAKSGTQLSNNPIKEIVLLPIHSSHPVLHWPPLSMLSSSSLLVPESPSSLREPTGKSPIYAYWHHLCCPTLIRWWQAE